MIPDIEHVAAKPRVGCCEATVWTRVGWWSSQSVRANPHATNNRKFQRVCNVIRAELIYDLSLHLSSMSVSTSRKYIPWYHAQTCLGATESWCLANSISGDIFIYIILFTYLAQMTWSNVTKDVERCRKLLPRSTHYYPDVSPETYQTISTQVIKPGSWFPMIFYGHPGGESPCRPSRHRAPHFSADLADVAGTPRSRPAPSGPPEPHRSSDGTIWCWPILWPSAMVKLQGQDSCVSPKFQILVFDTYLI